jgi:bifunctional oligoribonuclease and PAP phosphatase NrnA
VSNSSINKLSKEIKKSTDIVIIQAENPDGDSLASALALEIILVDMDKSPILHCAVSMPDHLKHLDGWDRVTNDLPNNFDMAIILDTTTSSLLERTIKMAGNKLSRVAVFVIDHHNSKIDFPFRTIDLIDENSVSTGEVIYGLANKLNWEINRITADMITTSIMYDSLGLMTEGTTADTLRIVADLVEKGVSLSELDAKRRELLKRDKEITNFKGKLLIRIEYALDDQLAYVSVPWEEIEKYSGKYNPAMLVLEDMKITNGVKVAVVFKTYPDGKLTAKIRSNYGYPVAQKIAEHFGGGGHPYAAGFKLRPGELDKTINDMITFLGKSFDETL